ncbi:MFS transporter small subunit [Actinomycetospora termitidis]
MSQATSGGRTVLTVVAWLWVLIPFLYGVWQLVIKLPALF